jgi:hypothetical protein
MQRHPVSKPPPSRTRSPIGKCQGCPARPPTLHVLVTPLSCLPGFVAQRHSGRTSPALAATSVSTSPSLSLHTPPPQPSSSSPSSPPPRPRRKPCEATAQEYCILQPDEIHIELEGSHSSRRGDEEGRRRGCGGAVVVTTSASWPRFAHPSSA